MRGVLAGLLRELLGLLAETPGRLPDLPLELLGLSTGSFELIVHELTGVAARVAGVREGIRARRGAGVWKGGRLVVAARLVTTTLAVRGAASRPTL